MGYDFSEEAELTDEQLGSAIDKLGPLTREELEAAMPEGVDSNTLDELIGIVNGAADRNRKVAQLRQRVADLGEAAVKIAKNIALA